MLGSELDAFMVKVSTQVDTFATKKHQIPCFEDFCHAPPSQKQGYFI
jgi:hypothetical protein